MYFQLAITSQNKIVLTASLVSFRFQLSSHEYWSLGTSLQSKSKSIAQVYCGFQFTVQLPSDCCSNLIQLAFFYLLSTVNVSLPITGDDLQLLFKGNCNSQYNCCTRGSQPLPQSLSYDKDPTNNSCQL